jgi:hypothetical protein
MCWGAAGIFVWFNPQRSTSTGEGAAESTVALETFVVNLNGSGQRAYLRVGITPGLAHPLPTRNHPLEIPPMVPVQSLGNKEPRTKKVERQTRKPESEELGAKSEAPTTDDQIH